VTVLKMAFHSATGRRIVSVYDNSGRFVAGIYPDETSNGIRIVSEHIASHDLDDGKTSNPAVPALTVGFTRVPRKKEEQER